MNPHVVKVLLCRGSDWELFGALRKQQSRPPRVAVISAGLARARGTCSMQGSLVAGSKLSRPRITNATSLCEIVSRSTRAATTRVQAPRVGSPQQVVTTQNEERSRLIRSVQACSLLRTFHVSRLFVMIERPLRSIPLLLATHPSLPRFSESQAEGFYASDDLAPARMEVPW